MNKFLISALTLFSLIQPQASAEENSAEALLHQMNHASAQLNYELSYILIKKSSIEPLIYRHAKTEKRSYSHLVFLSGPVREVIQRGDAVSYIEPGIEPFSIKSGSIVGPLVPMLQSDVAQLKAFYDFVLMGRAREAGAAAQVVRVVPKDGQRYSYVMWLDEKTSLPLRADLVDRDGEVLEQYRVVSYSVDDKIAEMLSSLDNVRLPDALSLPDQTVHPTGWRVAWVPKGFTSRSPNRYKMLMTKKTVESQIYSDGLFSFSVYVSERDELSPKGQLVRQGSRTLHSLIKGNKEITVVGDIPPSTAKQIALSVEFSSVTGG